MAKQIKIFFSLLTVLSISTAAFSTENSSETKAEEFQFVEFAMHHIADSYRWDFYHKKDHTAVGIALPRILWNKQENRLNIYLSTEKAVEHGYIEEHELNSEAGHGKLIIPGSEEKYEKLAEATSNAQENPEELKPLKKEMAKLRPIDLSITKNVLFLFFAAFLLIWVFTSVAKAYKRNPDKAPKGMQSFFEIIIVFVRDDVAKNFIPHHYEKFLPLLLNFFFFIWFLNMIGIMPFSANVTGNIAVTASLALIAMVVININGKKHYWEHIFWFPNVPLFVKPIMFIVEFVSIFTKPFALMIRLFANITAGHLVVLSFVSLIFLFGKLGQEAAAGWGTSVISVAFTLFIDIIELLIAALQAYIFTTLTALFIGQALEHE